MKLKLRILIFCALASFSPMANAVISFTFEGIITQDEGNAFELGESFTLTMTTRADLGSPNLFNDTTGVRWAYFNEPDDAPIWESVTLSGAIGTYSDPSSGSEAESQLRSDATRSLYVSAATYNPTFGLDLVKEDEGFWFFDIWLDTSETIAGYAGDASVTPDNTFFERAYDFTNIGAFFYTDNYTKEYQATITSFSISVTPVPEPSTYAAVLAVIVFTITCSARRGVRAI